MRLGASLALAWRSIRGHKLRSTLTTLGIVIGIAAVIAFVTLGASLQAGVIGDISPDDQRNSYGWASDPDTEGGPLAGAQPVFSEDDLETLSDDEDIDAAYGYMPISTQALVYEDELSPQSDALVAAGPTYIRDDTLEEGRQFEQGEREAVVNPAVAGQFEEDLETGDELTVALQGGEQTSVTVVGITETSEGLSPFEGFEPSPRVYVPTDPYYTEDAAGELPGGEAGGDGDAGGGEGTEGDEATDENAGANGSEDDQAMADARFLAIVVEAESADEEAIDRAQESATDRKSVV